LTFLLPETVKIDPQVRGCPDEDHAVVQLHAKLRQEEQLESGALQGLQAGQNLLN
jgi:coenzyme F420-reducing hydrogenase gamma subunit